MLSKIEKKRLRDRRAQQSLRDKKLRHTKRLEQQVAHCEQYHDDHKTQLLLQEIQKLQGQNTTLRRRQERLKCLVRSWDEDWDETPDCQETLVQQQQEQQQSLMPYNQPNNTIHDIARSSDAAASTTLLVPTAIPPSVSSFIDDLIAEPCLQWSILPLNDDDFSGPRGVSCPWFAHPEQIALCVDTPSPLDLLYGTKTNLLADMIHKELSNLPLQEPERLAVGWKIYHLTKWLISPNPTTYARIPEFLRPVWGQLQILHPMCLDLVTWPKVRLNLIQQWQFYKDHKDDLFQTLASCIRVKWPRGESILERNEQNELCIRAEFLDTLMSENGWALTPEVFAIYPDVVAGMNIPSLAYAMP
ncbi:hypothetical protein FE257_009595 [Aspergillus nanangensis]|uniref:BZIP domain-containing protein n=1 Tax=Aspergillus nanangensis TaxID=2582783 RepID=A0AAD4GRV2_ASPNN|nr:hypothetical protein FE257_009595 [Aspergillus nanangensis]